jgi:hypothetical protein
MAPTTVQKVGNQKEKFSETMIVVKIKKCVQLSVQSAGKLFGKLEKRREEKRKENGNQGRGKVYVKSVYIFLPYREATVGRRGCRLRMASAQAYQVNRED